MAEDKRDPSALFGQMVTQWETMSNQLANSVMGSSEFGKGQGAAMAATIKMREMMQEQMTRFLAAANMPSREEMTEMREAVAKLDAKLDRIEEKLDRIPAAGEGTARTGPPRTRKPGKSSGKATDG